MIVLNQNTLNNIYLTLAYKYNNIENDFDLIIEDTFTKSKRTVNVTDISINKNSISKFELTSTSTQSNQNLASGIVYLKTNKRYIYSIVLDDKVLDTNYLIAI